MPEDLNVDTPQQGDGQVQEPDPYSLGGFVDAEASLLMGQDPNEVDQPTQEGQADEESDAPSDQAQAPDGQPAHEDSEGAGDQEQQGNEAPADQQPVTEIEIDGAKHSVEDVKTALTRVQELTQLEDGLKEHNLTVDAVVQSGLTYEGAMRAFNSGPEGATGVIEALVNAAKEQYGDAFSADILSAIDPDTLLDSEKALYTGLQQARTALKQTQSALSQRDAQLAELRKNFSDLEQRVKPLTEKLETDSAAINGARLLKAKGIAVSAEDLATMMKETNEKDPEKAYKLATYDSVRKTSYDNGYRQGERPKPKTVGGSNLKTFDPMDPNLTADEMNRMIAKGYEPVTSK